MKSYSKDTVNKIGNAAVYMCERIPDMSKTKLLKLLYLLEECSVKKFQTPFFGIDFEVWQAGPVAKDIFIDLSDDYHSPSMLNEYLTVKTVRAAKDRFATYIFAKTNFSNDEFSDNDMAIMDDVIKEYGNKTANCLVKLTHKKNTAWYAAAKENELLDRFNAKTKMSSDVPIDFGYYLSECEKSKYLDTKETWSAFDNLK